MAMTGFFCLPKTEAKKISKKKSLHVIWCYS
jgi:hypothetical protein